MTKVELLKECVDFQSVENLIEGGEALEEGKVTPKKYYIQGPYVEADVKNGNGRTYPLKVLESQVQSYVNSRVAQNRAMGELGHPSTTDINLDRVSHLIKEMRMDKNIGFGKSVLMNTPMGMIAKSLIDEGVKLGVSSRGVGTMKNNVVQGDYRLITVDIVADPSAPSAFVEGILESHQGKEWVLENGILVEREIEQLENNLNQYAREDIRTATVKVFRDLLTMIGTKH